MEDERGFFARNFCIAELKEIDIDFTIKQTNISYNRFKGTIRGMHFQDAPNEEAKIVSCTNGSIKDYIIDLRRESPSYCSWISVELNSSEYTSLFIPKGFAHGFQTLEDDTIVSYLMDEFYYPNLARGIRWNDKLFNIDWADANNPIISDRDKSYPDYNK